MHPSQLKSVRKSVARPLKLKILKVGEFVVVCVVQLKMYVDVPDVRYHCIVPRSVKWLTRNNMRNGAL